MTVKHGEGHSEFTLCGLAFDAFDSKDADEPIEFAGAREIVTCEDCRRQIDYVKNNFSNAYRYTP